MIRYAEYADLPQWKALDRALSEAVYEEKLRCRQAYVCAEEGGLIGILRCNLFWDNTPFCTLLYIAEAYRGRGYGKQLMEYWERDMRSRGFRQLMTSTQADEDAQHFYRKLGYRDAGGFVPGHAQPLELIMIKEILPDGGICAPAAP